MHVREVRRIIRMRIEEKEKEQSRCGWDVKNARKEIKNVILAAASSQDPDFLFYCFRRIEVEELRIGWEEGKKKLRRKAEWLENKIRKKFIATKFGNTNDEN